MMRKNERFNKPIMFSAPDEVFETVSQTVIEDGVERSYLVNERMTERSKLQLNPSEVTLESLLASGVTIDPSRFVSNLGISEVSELESRKDSMSAQMLDYLSKHEDEIKQFITDNNIR